ncbi:MAG TPA: prepilin-type N-terminal cleavage/methylation domain-containing protein [Tepidisphaeraceae bacterium]|nr:prepilin-type N-terminal cleavage/methylation domain-containing protein [Tepidisphaeraceae bacterium]
MKRQTTQHERKRISRYSRNRRHGFTLVEIMCSLMIFAMVATAGTCLMGAMANGEEFFRDGTDAQSEVEFAIGRMVENVRAATAVSSPSSTSATSTLSLTSIAGQTVSYSRNSSKELVEQVGSTSNVLVHDVTTFSVAETSGNAKAFTITISAGTQEPITRTITVFGRNL